MDKRKMKYGVNSRILAVIVICIILLVNVFVSVLNNKVSLKIDMTQNDIYDISDATRQYLEQYSTPTQVYILSSEAEVDKKVSMVLDEFARLSSAISVKNINPAENPTFGKEYVSDGSSLVSGTVIFDSGDKFKLYTNDDLYSEDRKELNAESRFITALKYLAGEQDSAVYMTTGHNEKALNGLVKKLEAESCENGQLNLLNEDIPDNASMIVVAGPTTDFTSAEIAKLDAYLSNGGDIAFLFDPSGMNLENLFKYIKQWGIEPLDNVVVEEDTSYQRQIAGTGAILYLVDTGSSEITDSIVNNNRTVGYFPNSKEIKILFDENNGIKTTALFTSTDKAYTTYNYNDISKTDDCVTGTVNVGVFSENDATGGSIFVSGNTMLFTIDPDTIESRFGFANYDFFMNYLNYSSGNADYLSTAKSLTGNYLLIDVAAQRRLFIICIIIMPLAAIAVGVLVWIKRRNK